MKGGKLEPGAVCVVISEARGYERNIGVLITLVDYEVSGTWGSLTRREPGGVRGTWTFKEASRPILVAQYPDHFVTSSEPYEIGGGYFLVPAFAPHRLLPIKGDGTGEELWREQPLAHEKQLVTGPMALQHWNCRCVVRPIVKP
jgi:hypothetical protein